MLAINKTRHWIKPADNELPKVVIPIERPLDRIRDGVDFGD